MYQQQQSTMVRSIEFGRSGLAESEQEMLDTLFNTRGAHRKLQAGETIFMEGDDTDFVYRVVSGTVLSCIITPDGRRQISRFLSGGGTMGLAAIGFHSYTAEAVDNVEIQVCPRSIFDAAVREDQGLRDEVMQIISGELTAGHDLMVMLGRMSANERAAAFLLKLSEENLVTKAGYVPLPMNRVDIADYLGLTIETVSRMFNTLKRNGLIDMPSPDRFRVVDVDGLQSVAAPA
jgi:CRP/FNR family transcriptional regulator